MAVSRITGAALSKTHITYSSIVTKDVTITGTDENGTTTTYYALSTTTATTDPFQIATSQDGTALTGDALTAAVAKIAGATIVSDTITYSSAVTENQKIIGIGTLNVVKPTSYYPLADADNGIAFQISEEKGGAALTGDALTAAVENVDGFVKTPNHTITYPTTVSQYQALAGINNDVYYDYPMQRLEPHSKLHGRKEPRYLLVRH